MLRVLKDINSDSDVYQAVSKAEIHYVETQLNFGLPLTYKNMLMNPEVELVADIGLLWIVSHKSIGILDVNSWLHERTHNSYPRDLIAFATNEFGDYFCFRRSSNEIVYIDPEIPVEESLQDRSFVFQSFDDWLEYKKVQRTNLTK